MQKFVIRVEARFEAAHHLREYYGAPEPLHGHSWKVEVKIQSTKLDKEDISVDYVKVKKAVEALAKKFDYHCINEVPPFDKINPSSENIAKWFYDNLNKKKLLRTSKIQEVILWEGPFNYLAYSR